jgi:hypothetical protein
MSEQESRHTNREASFDELAKGLAGGTLSRGKMLKMMGAALFGGAVASIPGVALAAPKPGKGPCRPGQVQCGKKCCPETASCVKGKCVCPNNTVLDNGQCVSPTCTPGVCGSYASCGISSVGDNCVCFKTANGAGLCAPPRIENCGGEGQIACPNGQTDCPTGMVCIVDTCCGEFGRPNVCVLISEAVCT